MPMNSAASQLALIYDTYRCARFDPSDPADRYQCFEAFDTVVQARDPAEVEVIYQAFFDDDLNYGDGLYGSAVLSMM